MRQSKNKSLAMKKADKYYSLYIRYKHADKDGYCKCYTCGERHHWKEIHTGHFASRRYQSTRYDEMNTKPQCVSCNSFHQGRQFEFGINLDRELGIGTAEKVMMKSKMLCKRTKFDYEMIAEEYKKKYENLLKEKSLE